MSISTRPNLVAIDRKIEKSMGSYIQLQFPKIGCAMEEMSTYHSIPTSCQIFVQASKIATDFLHCLTLWISPIISLKPKYDLMRDQHYKPRIYLKMYMYM